MHLQKLFSAKQFRVDKVEFSPKKKSKQYVFAKNSGKGEWSRNARLKRMRTENVSEIVEGAALASHSSAALQVSMFWMDGEGGAFSAKTSLMLREKTFSKELFPISP